MPNILNIGSVNMDIVTSADQTPQPGETILVDNIQFIPGGKGANAAVAAARLGAKVTFVGAIGNDAFAETLRTGLIANKIDCAHLITTKTSSGTAIITVNNTTGQNSIMVGMGANALIELPEDDAIFKSTDAVMLQLETPVNVNIDAAQKAKSYNKLVILDPAPATSNLPDKLISHCDIISPNETELATLTGLPTQSLDQIKQACKILLGKGCKTVIAKLSDKGTYIQTSDLSIHVPAFAIEPVDTTAAGDSFTACLTLELAKQSQPYDYAHAVRYANAAGALACLKFGAQTSLPTREELEQFLRSQN